jgi:hypothetical protein
MEVKGRTRFHYDATAHALSGQFWRPFQRVIEVQAPSSLPTIGGVGNSRVEDFRLDDFVSFKAGYTHVLGSQKSISREGRKSVEQSKHEDKSWTKETEEGESKIVHTTQVTATVEGLNILDVVTADRIVARLTSSHDPDEPEGRILLIGSKFENLRIAGCAVDVRLDHELLLELETFAAVREKWREPHSEFRKAADDTLRAFLPRDAQLPQMELQPHGALPCSIVKEVYFKDSSFDQNAGRHKAEQEGTKKFQHPCPGVERLGRHRFHVRDFGDIYLAEVLFEHGRKTLTMLRLELGSPNGGAIGAVEASVNGRPPYP